MQIKRLYMGGRLENYNYLGVCSDSSQAFVVDPLRAEPILNYLHQHGLTLTKILITHEHGDHVAAVPELQKQTKAELIAPLSLKGHPLLVNVAQWLAGGEVLEFGLRDLLKVIQIPGHTLSHIGFYVDQQVEQPVFFCGDTIFHSGVGNCYNGGDPVVLYQTIVSLLDWLPDNTRICPAHDNIVTNLKFSLSREPSNQDAQVMLDNALKLTPDTRMATTIGEEKTYNPFMRLNSPELKQKLAKDRPDTSFMSDQDVFVALRELRDVW